jgi:hypothetical protein
MLRRCAVGGLSAPSAYMVGEREEARPALGHLGLDVRVARLDGASGRCHWKPRASSNRYHCRFKCAEDSERHLHLASVRAQRWLRDWRSALPCAAARSLVLLMARYHATQYSASSPSNDVMETWASESQRATSVGRPSMTDASAPAPPGMVMPVAASRSASGGASLGRQLLHAQQRRQLAPPPVQHTHYGYDTHGSGMGVYNGHVATQAPVVVKDEPVPWSYTTAVRSKDELPSGTTTWPSSPYSSMPRALYQRQASAPPGPAGLGHYKYSTQPLQQTQHTQQTQQTQQSGAGAAVTTTTNGDTMFTATDAIATTVKKKRRSLPSAPETPLTHMSSVPDMEDASPQHGHNRTMSANEKHRQIDRNRRRNMSGILSELRDLLPHRLPAGKKPSE